MAQSDSRRRIAICAQIEVSLVHSGLNRSQVHELEHCLQQIPGVQSTKSTNTNIVVYPLSAQYALGIQTEVENVVQNYFQFNLDGQHVLVGQNN